MELDQWLHAYGAITRSSASKEQSLWSAFVGFLLAQCILVLAYVLVEPDLLGTVSDSYRFGTIALGGLVAFVWLLSQSRLRAELLHFERLLRQVEGQFAGGEFYRSLHQLSKGKQICISGANHTCNEWLPEIARLPLLGRLSASALAAFVPLLFVLGWLAVLVDKIAM
jgi:hypothetical protein